MGKGNKIIQYENMLMQNFYFQDLKNLACSRFVWQGLPNFIPSRFIEMNLFHNGQLAFFKDKNLGYMITKCTPQGLNAYDDPLKWNCYAIDYSETYDPDDVVILNNNILRTPTAPNIMYFVTKIMEAEKGIKANIINTKTPILFLCDDKNKLALKQLYKDYVEGEPVAFVDKGLELEKIRVQLTPCEFITDKLHWYKNAVYNEAKTFLGINNNQSQDKKERLVTNEVDVNNEEIYHNLMSFYNPRLEFVKEVKEKFGIEISCKCVADFEEPDDKKEGVGECHKIL